MPEKQERQGFPLILECPECGCEVDVVYTGTATLDGYPAYTWKPCPCMDVDNAD